MIFMSKQNLILFAAIAVVYLSNSWPHSVFVKNRMNWRSERL